MKSSVYLRLSILAAAVLGPFLAHAASTDTAPARAVMVAYCEKTAQPPVIDGKLDDPCWKDCQPLGSFVSDRVDRLAGQQTTARICYDDRCVYFAFDCREDDMAHTKAVTTGQSLPWFEDSVEIFIDPKYTQEKYEHFGANFLGATNIKSPADAPGMVMTKGMRDETGYTIEVRIPFSALKIESPIEGKTWGLNLARNRYRPDGKENSSWGRLRGSFHKPAEFGQLIFAPRPEVQIESVMVSWKTEGTNLLEVSVKNTTSQPASIELTAGEAKSTTTVPPGESNIRGLLKLAAGLNHVLVCVRSGKELIYQQSLPVVCGPVQPGMGEVAGLGCFRIVTIKPVYFQGEELVATAESAIAEPEAATTHVSLSANVPGAAEKKVSGGEELRVSLPQGDDRQATLVLTITDAKGNRLQEITKPVPIRGIAKGDYEERINALEGRLKALSFPEGSQPAREVDYSKLKMARLRQLVSEMTDASVRQLNVQLPELSYTLDTLQKSKSPVWGLRNRIYVSDIDGSEQGYVVAAPSVCATDGTGRFPVLIFMHGFINDAPWSPEGKLDPMQLACLSKGVIAVSPYGRGSQGYRYDGERDVMAVLDEVRRDYRVDEDRIYLGGFSMGAEGTLTISCARPDWLAAIAPCSSWPKPDQLPNLRHVPGWFFCGGQEDCVPLITKALEVLKSQGTEAHFTSDPASGHTTDFIDFDKLVDWLLGHQLVRNPKQIRFVCQQPSHSQAYWATIEGFVDYGKPASIDITAEGQRLTIQAQNVTALRLNPPAEVLDPAKPVEIVLNGVPQPALPPGHKGSFRVQCLSPAPKAIDGPVKSADTLSGPIAEVFAAPFIVVYGTGEDAQNNQTDAELFVKDWNAWHHGSMTIQPDTAITDEVVKSRNLIVVGTPAKDSVVAKSIARLPFSVTKDRIRVSDQAFAGKDLGVCVLGVNPLAANRYVLFVISQDKAGLKLALQQLSVHDSRKRVREDFVVLEKDAEEKPKVLGAGWFATDWKTVTLREPEKAAEK